MWTLEGGNHNIGDVVHTVAVTSNVKLAYFILSHTD